MRERPHIFCKETGLKGKLQTVCLKIEWSMQLRAIPFPCPEGSAYPFAPRIEPFSQQSGRTRNTDGFTVLNELFYVKTYMRRYYFTILCLACLIFPLTGQVLIQDSVALVALYQSTSGPQWTNKDNWLNGPVSGWYGVTTQGNRVVQLNLWNNGLSGSIPPEIGHLTALHELSLGMSDLEGPIPHSLGRLTELNVLNLRRSGIQGLIPDSLGSCTQLVQLYLGENRLEGGLPSSLAQLKSLRNLHLNKNNLSGPFPEVLTEMPGLLSLDISDNKFSGALPSWLNKLVQLESLAFSNNSFEGSMPKLDSLVHLISLNFNNNKLSGNLDTLLGHYPEMLYCEGSGNAFTGLLSPAHFNPQKAVILDFSDNLLTELGNFSNWDPNPNFLRVVIINNRLDFDDLAQNAGLPAHKLWWYPQGLIGKDTILVIQAGSKVVLSSPMKNQEIQYTWFRNGNSIPGANGAEYTIESFNPAQAGGYSFRASHPWFLPENPIRGATFHLALPTTAIPELDPSLFKIIYTGSRQTLQVAFHQPFHTKQVSLILPSGQVIKSFKTGGEVITIPMDYLPTGIYFVELKTEKGRGLARIFKR